MQREFLIVQTNLFTKHLQSSFIKSICIAIISQIKASFGFQNNK